MTEIKDLKNKMMTVKNAIDNNNQETTKFLTQNLTFYHLVPTEEISTFLNYLVEFDKLLAFFESIQDFDFDLLAPAYCLDFLTEDFFGKNLIEL